MKNVKNFEDIKIIHKEFLDSCMKELLFFENKIF